MKRPRLSLVLLVAALTIPAAHAAQKSLRLGHPFVLNGVVVEPGEYAVELAPSLDAVKLKQGREVVVSSPCKVSSVEGPSRSDEVHSRLDSRGRDEIVRLVLAGSRMSIEMTPSAEAALAAGRGIGARR
jgi:hypothetical protein